MKRRLSIIFGFLVTAQGMSMGVAHAQAQPTSTTSRFEKLRTPDEATPIGSRVSRRADYVSANDRDAAWTMHRFAQCLVRTRHAQMLELLSTRLNSVEQNRIVREIIGWRSRCLRARSMKIDNVVLRGAVAEAFYREERRSGKAARTTPPRLLDADPARDSAAAVEAFGRCMVRRDARVAEALINTRPGSADESRAMQAVLAGLPHCMPSAPPRARHPLLLRGALAEAYIHQRAMPVRPVD